MATAFVIVVGSGEYSDRSERPIRVFLNGDDAQADMKMLDEIRARHFPIRRLNGESWEQLWDRRKAAGKLAMADYEAAGYEVWDGEVDWELNEVPLMGNMRST